MKQKQSTAALGGFNPRLTKLARTLMLVAAMGAAQLGLASAHSLERAGLAPGAAHTSTEPMTGTIYAISASLPATYDAVGYGATTITYTVIGSVITFTPYGADRDVTKVKPINGAVEKIKGQADYGDGDMTMSYLPLDAGQVILKAAEANMSQHYSMKITYPDGEIHYLDIIVASYKYPGAKEGEPFLTTCKLGICKAPVVVAAV